MKRIRKTQAAGVSREGQLAIGLERFVGHLMHAGLGEHQEG